MTATPLLASRRPAGLRLALRLASVTVAWVVLAWVVLAWVVLGAATPAAADVSQCRAIDDPTARLRCYESFAPPDLQLPPSPGAIAGPGAPQSIGSWRLVRTPNPRGGKEAVSIMRPGDLSGSDPNFVGLMIRCAEPDIEVLLVMLHPLAFRARPRVAIDSTKYDSSVAPPGLNILLPRDVAVLAGQRWPSLPSVSFEIDDSGTVTRGRVSLADFDAARKALTAACPLRQ